MNRGPVANPYVGLRPFTEADARYFFGRDGQVDPMIDLLASHRFLAVVGVSGSGKSSLVRAGLLPALHAGGLPTGQREWEVVDMKPRHQPLRNLAEALAESAVLAAAQEGLGSRANFADAALRNGSNGIADLVGQALSGDRHDAFGLLILVDQFEEIFRFARLGSSNEADQFIQLLLSAADQRIVPIHVVITMRSDFLGDCARFRGLPEHLNGSQFIIPRLERPDLRAAIEGPARLADTVMEPALVTRLLNDLGDEPNRLPLLQHALRRLWARSSATQPGDSPISQHMYLTQVGTLDGDPKATAEADRHGALHRHAQEVLDRLPDEESRRHTEHLFKALTEIAPDNRPIRRPETAGRLATLLWPDELHEAALTKLEALTLPFRTEDTGFLTPSSPSVSLTPETTIDISHESLISHWTTLTGWVRQEAGDAKQLRRLFDDAERGVHYENDLLTTVESWWTNRQPSRAWAERYLPGQWDHVLKFWKSEQGAAIQRRESQRRNDRLKRALVSCTVIALSLGVAVSTWFMIKARKAESAAHAALTQSFLRTIGRGKLHQAPTTIELDSLWELAELKADNEPVRSGLPTAWFGASDDPLPALAHEQAGLRAGLALQPSRYRWHLLAKSIVAALENTQETDGDRLSSLTEAFNGLAGKLDPATAANLAERLIKALENTQETDGDRLSSLTEAFSKVLPRVELQPAAELAAQAVLVLARPIQGPQTNPAEQLAKRITPLAPFLPKGQTGFRRWALSMLLLTPMNPAAEQDPTGPEDNQRRLVREISQQLSKEELTDVLKWPLCGGEAQKVVLAVLEEETGAQFDGDVWSFVDLAPSLGIKNLKDPARRPSLEKALQELKASIPARKNTNSVPEKP